MALSHPKLTPEVISKFYSIAQKDQHAARRYLGGALQVKKSQRNEWAARLLREGGMEVDTGGSDGVANATSVSDEFNVDVETSRAATLAEVVEMCKVDLEKWDAKGFSVRRGKSGFAWNARFSKKEKELDVEPILALFETEAKKHAPHKWVYEKVAAKQRDCLYVLATNDLHFGKLAFSPETGDAPWDTRIADNVFRLTVDELMDKAPKDRIEEVLIIAGSDQLQVDNNNSTTFSGTYVDSDSRLAKVFDVAARALTDTVEKLASRFRVRVVVIPGNHDTTMSYLMGKYIEAWFRTHPNVVVDSSPKSRKYYGYGKTLIGFDHGCDTRLVDLPLILMRENQETISQYRFQEFITGDKHHEHVDDIKGVRVRISPALCPPDRWHAAKGYVGNLRQSQGLLYQRENGLEAIYYSKPLN